MYELIQVSEHDYYIDCPAKIGLVRTGEKTVVMIDGGSEKDAGKKALRHIEENGWVLQAVYLTHAHADHMGGCRYLQEKTACAVYAKGAESAVARNPILEPTLLWGGYPHKALRCKFLMAQDCDCRALAPEALPQGWEIIDLPGHYFDMVGFQTPDGNLYLADCLCSEETLEKYKIGFLWDVEAFLNTLERVKTMEAKHFIPAHAQETENIAPLAEKNIASVLDTAELIVRLCESEPTFEELLQKLFTELDMKISAQQYALIGSTLRSYLSYLSDCGRLEYYFENNEMRWRSLS